MKHQEWNHCRSQFNFSEKRWPTLTIVTIDLSLLFLTFYLQSIGSFYILLGALPLSVVLLHAYLWLHEATHSAVSRRKNFNNLIGHLCGWIILMPFLARQRSHLLHHKWTGHPVGDPANKRLIERFSVINPQQKRTLEWIWSSWIPLVTLNDRIGIWKDAFQERKAGNKSSRIKKEIQFIYIYSALYCIFTAILVYQGVFLSFMSIYLPAFIIELFLEELANAPHHAEAPLIGETDKPLPYWEQDKVTHSCKSLPIWSKYVLLNFNLHTAHHYFPWAPWYLLPQLNQEITKIDPCLEKDIVQHEIAWSLKNRKKPLFNIMAHYFDKIPTQIK